MIDSRGDIIYIGKAKNLKKRVSSYFTNSKNHHPKTRVMVTRIEHIDVIITKSEPEALILEAQLIKKHQPRYNVMLKDDKSFPYIKVTTNEIFPRVLVTREKSNDNASYFGPFPSIGSTRKLLRLIYDMFPLRDCKQKIDLENMQPKCINLDIGKCIGPCVIKEIKPQYDELVSDLKLLLLGKNQQLMDKFSSEMRAASDKKDFETAADLRDRIYKIQRISQRQLVDLSHTKNMFVWGCAENDEVFYCLVQSLIEGKLMYQTGFYFAKDELGSKEMWIQQAFLSAIENKEIVYKEIIGDKDVIAAINVLPTSVLFDYPVQIQAVQRGKKAELVEMANRNAKIALKKIQHSQDTKHKPNRSISMDEVATTLELEIIPDIILGFDISHLQGSDIVASSVCFNSDGPLKEGYRKYSIKSVKDKSNDPKSIQEAVERRLEQEKKKPTGTAVLLLIDGGRAQLNYAVEAINRVQVPFPVVAVGLAKREEDIYRHVQGDILTLDKSNRVLQFLQRVRDESHRFANAFQEKKRNKRAHDSILSNIKGLGITRINALYRKFKSIQGMKGATVEELAAVGRIGPTLAQKVKDVIAIYEQPKLKKTKLVLKKR